MKLSNLFSLACAAALLGVTALACSSPDVGAYGDTGSNASAGTADKSKTSKKNNADDGKDDDGTDDGDAPLKTTPTTGDPTPTTPGATTTTPAPDTTTTETAPPPAPTATPEDCFNHCISPQPEAVAYNTCAEQCTGDDSACVEGCYESSSCSTTPDCGTAVTNCDTKCPLQ